MKIRLVSEKDIEQLVKMRWDFTYETNKTNRIMISIQILKRSASSFYVGC